MVTPGTTFLVAASFTKTFSGALHWMSRGACVSWSTHSPLAGWPNSAGWNMQIFGPGLPFSGCPLHCRSHTQLGFPASHSMQPAVSRVPNWSFGTWQKGRHTGRLWNSFDWPHSRASRLPETSRRAWAQETVQAQGKPSKQSRPVHCETSRVPWSSPGSLHGISQVGGISNLGLCPSRPGLHSLAPSFGPFGSAFVPPAQKTWQVQLTAFSGSE
mmetsp:Transcript_7254/g.21326  ORF Transcript_7254/g.21326 Transcript_7254/m.21326 type:complete len:214 (+) Transcript_7254:1731-2372(+)